MKRGVASRKLDDSTQLLLPTLYFYWWIHIMKYLFQSIVNILKLHTTSPRWHDKDEKALKWKNSSKHFWNFYLHARPNISLFDEILHRIFHPHQVLLINTTQRLKLILSLKVCFFLATEYEIKIKKFFYNMGNYWRA